jgi:osmotically inducible protein OsmC
MPVRTSEATWEGTLKDGSGDMTVGDNVYQGAYSFASRFQEGEGTNPEELIAAAHAGCYSMALSNGLDEAGFDPTRVHTEAAVHLEDGQISLIELEVEAAVPDIDEESFQEAAEEAKVNCPVSQALAAVPEITLHATLT